MKEFMHVGVPTTVAREGEIYAEGIKTHLITPDTNEFHIEYLRFRKRYSVAGRTADLSACSL